MVEFPYVFVFKIAKSKQHKLARDVTTGQELYVLDYEYDNPEEATNCIRVGKNVYMFYSKYPSSNCSNEFDCNIKTWGGFPVR